MKKQTILMHFFALFILALNFESQVSAQKFTSDIETFKQYKYPEWFRDAKFGIWSHWGPQAVPRQGDWYARLRYLKYINGPLFLSPLLPKGEGQAPRPQTWATGGFHAQMRLTGWAMRESPRQGGGVLGRRRALGGDLHAQMRGRRPGFMYACA